MKDSWPKFKEKFFTIYDDHKSRNGQRFEVLGKKPAHEYDIEYVGVMWKIRFEDGTVLDAFPEEVEEEINFEVMMEGV